MAYDEETVSAYMQGDKITIRVELGLNTGQARVRTCDLTHGYITINGDYRS
jgi:glutamate N-acetyltransferase / amino-acid N-acetyltransferase